MNEPLKKEMKSKRHQFALDVFRREGNNSLVVFLCGKNISYQDSLRAKIGKALKKFDRVKIAYPEMLFSDDRVFAEDDMLELEKKLAKWVDIVIIPMESESTFVELGAFCALPDLLVKVMVFNNEKYKKGKTFINLGPIKAIRKKNETHVNYFSEENVDQDVELFAERVSRKTTKIDHKDLSNIFNLSRLIRTIIAIWQPISKKNIAVITKDLYPESDAKSLQACLDNLIESDQIISNSINSREHYSLSKNGFKEYLDSIEKCQSLRKHTESRAQSLRATYIRRKDFKGGGARKFLDIGNTSNGTARVG